MSNTSSTLDKFDPFAGLSSTDPTSRTSESIAGDVSSIRKTATDPIDASSKDNVLGIETVTPQNGALDKALNDYTSDTLGRMSSAYQTKTENFSLDDLRQLGEIEDGKIKFNKDYLMDQMSDVLGFTLGDSEAFKGEMGDVMFDLFVKATSPDGGALLDKNGNELTFKDGWRDGTTEGLIYSLAMAGLEIYQEIKDSAAEDSFDATSLYSAAQNGMVEAYRPIFDKIKPRAKAESMMITALRYVIHNGDMNSLREMLNILGSSHYPKIRSTYPTMPKDFLSQYYFDPKLYLHEHAALCQELKGFFEDIYGEDWYRRTTFMGKAYDVSIGFNASLDAVKLLSTDDDLAILVALKDTFSEQAAAEAFFDAFEDVPRIEA